MNVSEIMSTIKKATAFDIFLISFFVLPFIFDAWIEVLTKINASQEHIFWSLVVLFVVYLITVIILVIDNHRKKRKEIAKDLIVGYLQSKGFTMMSFDRVRQKLNSNYENNFLEDIIQEFPREVRSAKLKGGKLGIARIVGDEADSEEV